MYWKNYMISYSGKDSSSYITKLKYEWDSVSDEQLIDDLTHMRVISNIELEPGYFDDYEKYLSWDKKFYNIPDYICKQTIDEWNKLQEKYKLTEEDKERIKQHYINPLTKEYFMKFEYKVDRNHIKELIKLHNDIRKEDYDLSPIDEGFYDEILKDFHYKED